MADLDGFNVNYATKPGGWEDFIELALPELRRQGLARERYDEQATTLRESFYGAGRSRTLPDHPASKIRAALHEDTALA